jgi:hypothetical protein
LLSWRRSRRSSSLTHAMGDADWDSTRPSRCKRHAQPMLRSNLKGDAATAAMTTTPMDYAQAERPQYAAFVIFLWQSRKFRLILLGCLTNGLLEHARFPGQGQHNSCWPVLGQPRRRKCRSVSSRSGQSSWRLVWDYIASLAKPMRCYVDATNFM